MRWNGVPLGFVLVYDFEISYEEEGGLFRNLLKAFPLILGNAFCIDIVLEATP